MAGKRGFCAKMAQWRDPSEAPEPHLSPTCPPPFPLHRPSMPPPYPEGDLNCAILAQFRAFEPLGGRSGFAGSRRSYLEVIWIDGQHVCCVRSWWLVDLGQGLRKAAKGRFPCNPPGIKSLPPLPPQATPPPRPDKACGSQRIGRRQWRQLPGCRARWSRARRRLRGGPGREGSGRRR